MKSRLTYEWRCLYAFSFLALDDTKEEPINTDSIFTNRHFNKVEPSDKQTLKIEEAFTSSTRHAGKMIDLIEKKKERKKNGNLF